MQLRLTRWFAHVGAALRAAGRSARRVLWTRRAAVTTLVVVASVLVLGAAISLYAREVALNTDTYTKVSGEFLESDQIRPVLAAYLVNQLYTSTDVAGALEDVLPDQYDRLAPEAAAGLRQLALRTANQILSNPKVQTLWRDANRNAHEQFLALIDDTSSSTVEVQGEVVLDLRPLLVELAHDAGLPGVVLENLPTQAGQLVILDQEQVDQAGDLADALRIAAFALLGASLVVWIFTVWLARERRRETVRALGIGLALVGLVLLVLRRFIGTAIVDSVVEANSVQPAGEAAWLIATEVLQVVAWFFIALGLLAVLWAWLCGPTRIATRFRRWSAPTMRERRLAVYGGAVALALILLAWGPFGDATGAVGIAVVLVLGALGIETFRRRAAAELAQAGEDAPSPS